jgi:tRNA pseudouridine55 synthase
MARRRKAPWIPPGVLVLWKPVGPTSHDLVDYVRRLLPRRAKVGHAGTLDPFAEGILPLCLGGATRLADQVGDQPKTYLALADLSADTDTGDPTGEVTARFEEPEGFGAELVQAGAAALTGEIEQVPPAYSAIRIDGERAYDRARRGEDVEIPARVVTVHRFEVLEVQWPLVRFRVVCSKGTYVRSLARDLGRHWGGGGHLKELAREAVGRLDRARAHTPFELVGLEPLSAGYVPLEEALPDAVAVRLPDGDVARIQQGNPIEHDHDGVGSLLVAYPEAGGPPVAACRATPGGGLRPWKVFPRREG